MRVGECDDRQVGACRRDAVDARRNGLCGVTTGSASDPLGRIVGWHPGCGCNQMCVRSELTNSHMIVRALQGSSVKHVRLANKEGDTNLTHRSQFIAVSLVAGTLAVASVAIAQSSTSTARGGQAPAQHHGMTMDGHHGMMHMMTGVDPALMTRMLENCNRMMEITLQETPKVPTAPAPPEGKPNG